jgi:DNA polymerase-3 subunit gamma/tau
MSSQVSARKWRPKNFQEMVGQQHVLKALVHALETQKLHHAYLFTGTRGVGKTTVARILAKCLNCEQGITATPCGGCSACIAIDQGCFVDLIEVDAASRTKVEDTRELLDNVQYLPTQGRFKIYLIDEVHMLSGHSFNALLKTLEEPPEHVKFLLATTDPQKLPVTVLSRCLQFHLKHLTEEDIAQQIRHILTSENVTFEQEATQLLADAAKGSMRDGLSLMDQAVAFGGGSLQAAQVREMLGNIDPKVVQIILQALQAQDGSVLLQAVESVASETGDFAQALTALIQALHDIAVLQAMPDDALKTQARFAAVAEFASQFTPEDMQLFYQIALQGRRDLPWAASERSGFEMILLRMLAFQPASSGVAITSVKKQQAAIKAESSAAEKPEPRPEAEPESPEEESFFAIDAAWHAKMEPPPVATAAVEPELAPQSDGIDWAQLLPQLRLTGMAATLASHCVVKAFNNNVLSCALSPKHAPLYSEGIAQRIAEALSKHMRQEIKLMVKIEAQGQETPAQQQEKAQAVALDNAKSNLFEDATIKALESAFDAKLDENSVKNL